MFLLKVRVFYLFATNIDVIHIKIEMKMSYKFDVTLALAYPITYFLLFFHFRCSDMSLNLKIFSDLAAAQHAKLYGSIMSDIGAKDIPSEIEYHKLLIAKIHSMDASFDQVEGPYGIVKPHGGDNSATSLSGNPLRCEQEVVAKSSTTKLTSQHIKKNPLKITKKQMGADGAEEEVEVAIDFPYLSGVDYTQSCQSLKMCGGLLAPCLTRRPKEQDYCKACTKIGNPHGTIQDRSSVSMLCYQSPKGKSEITFGTYVTKRGLDIDEVKTKIMEEYGVELPGEYWKIDKTKASRIVKTVSTSSDDEASVEGDGAKTVAKKRGRPKKVKSEEASTDEASVEGDGAKTVAKKRGRPKKAKSEEASADEASVEGDGAKTVAKKRGRPKKLNIVSADETSNPSPKGAAEKELEEEPVEEVAPAPKENDYDVVSDSESESEDESAEVEVQTNQTTKANGVPYKREDGRVGLMWDGKECFLDEAEDNEVTSLLGDCEKVIGYWCPETKTVLDSPRD